MKRGNAADEFLGKRQINKFRLGDSYPLHSSHLFDKISELTYSEQIMQHHSSDLHHTGGNRWKQVELKNGGENLKACSLIPVP